MNGYLSSVAVSNLITMSIASKHDQRQRIGEQYSMPSEEIRLLRAKVIFEEALETIEALGCQLSCPCGSKIDVRIDEDKTPPDFEKIIDGCCDTIYVAVGTLVSCGVPDVPHLQEVCEANEDKFPKGQATFNESGKFLKPDGWEPPNHTMVQQLMEGQVSLREMSEIYVRAFKRVK